MGSGCKYRRSFAGLPMAHLLLCSLRAGDPCSMAWPQTPSLCPTFEFCFCASVPDGFYPQEELLHEASQDSYVSSHKLQDKTNLLPHLPLGRKTTCHRQAQLRDFGCCLVTMSYFFVTPWTLAHQGSVYGVSLARILEWVAISFSRRSSRPGDRTCISCNGRRVLYHLSHQGSPSSGMLWAFSGSIAMQDTAR